MEKRKTVCINCPMGCSLEVTIDGENISVSGNTCKRGAEYGINEVRDPRRTVTSTIKVEGGDRPVVSVKTDRDIPKRLIFDIMKEINGKMGEAPVKIGDILIENVLETGANIIATSNVEVKR
jgi:CxxC motif-containing protein